MNKAKSKLLDIFSKLDSEPRPLNLHHHSKVLIIDGVNTFIRSFAVVNHVNSYGNHVGGLTGFLKSIGSAIRQIQPTKCIIVFDGEAGSRNRKYLYPEYKGNRTSKAIVNYKSFNNKQEEKEAQENEISRLVDYLNCLPVSLICVDKLEADDIIGYLSRKIYNDYDDSQVYVMSSDNDFLQLVNDRTFLFSPTKKITYDVDSVIKNYGVHPENFLLYKTLIGDSSDNIPGVTGFGEKNTVKMFTILQEDSRKTLDDLFEVCKNPPKKSILYDRVLEVEGLVNVFYKIMNLREPNISDEDKEDIHSQYYKKPGVLQRHNFVSLLRYDRINDATLNSDNWIKLFSILNNF